MTSLLVQRLFLWRWFFFPGRVSWAMPGLIPTNHSCKTSALITQHPGQMGYSTTSLWRWVFICIWIIENGIAPDRETTSVRLRPTAWNLSVMLPTDSKGAGSDKSAPVLFATSPSLLPSKTLHDGPPLCKSFFDQFSGLFSVLYCISNADFNTYQENWITGSYGQNVSTWNNATAWALHSAFNRIHHLKSPSGIEVR